MASAPTPPAGETRLGDRALVLAIATFLLLTPPVIAVFDVAVPVLGVPLLHVYTFAVWIAAIALGGILARRLMRASEAPPPQEP